MKKQLTILLTVICCLAVLLCACTPQAIEHKCQHVCSQCSKCMSDCTDEACKDKCPGHQAAAHQCEHVCEVCGNCTSECSDSVCAQKCAGHIKVTEIVVNTDDENEGTLASPRSITVVQGNSASATYNVKPKDAENKAFVWTFGTIDDGVFTKVETDKLTLTDSGSKLTIAAAADATSMALEGKAADGSGVVVYIIVNVQEYHPVTAITATGLKAAEDKEWDYELLTAQYTSWDMTDGILQRGQQLLDGEIFARLQAPHNLTYYGNIRNIGLTIAPENASEKDVEIKYSQDGVVTIDASGNISVVGAGETIVTITSVSEADVAIKIKVTVAESLYRGITMDAYNQAEVAANIAGGWDLDADHATDKQNSRYDDWHLVMVHSNDARGTVDSEDGNQKIFYMGESTRPYGICLENNVTTGSGADLTLSASMMWAKVTIPDGAITFNVKIGNNNDKTYGQYRVVFVAEDGTATVLSDGWQGFTGANEESTQKFAIPAEIIGKTGAMVIEHRLSVNDKNAELGIKVLKFEGQVNVSSVVFENATATYKQGERTFTIKANVKPDNATNDKVTYAMAADSADGVSIDANSGVVTVSASAIGEYRIIASAVADVTKTAEFVLTITADEIEVNKWSNKSEILDGVSDVKWYFINEGCDAGVGEGADLSIRNGGVTYAAIQLDARKIKNSSFILKFGARVFVRDGETYPKFVVKVSENGTDWTLIKGIGQTEDWFYVDTDETQYCSYDLSAYIGKTVSIQIGITEGTHAVVQNIEFFGNEENITAWANKAAILNVDADAWEVNGTWNTGAGEGVDLQGEGAYAYNKFVIGSYNASITFGGRIFIGQEGEKGNPDVKLVVVCDEVEMVITANGSESDTITLNSDNVTSYTYDLSQFIGKEVEIRIVCVKEVYHCVIANIAMGAIA